MGVHTFHNGVAGSGACESDDRHKVIVWHSVVACVWCRVAASGSCAVLVLHSPWFNTLAVSQGAPREACAMRGHPPNGLCPSRTSLIALLRAMETVALRCCFVGTRPRDARRGSDCSAHCGNCGLLARGRVVRQACSSTTDSGACAPSSRLAVAAAASPRRPRERIRDRGAYEARRGVCA